MRKRTDHFCDGSNRLPASGLLIAALSVKAHTLEPTYLNTIAEKSLENVLDIRNDRLRADG